MSTLSNVIKIGSQKEPLFNRLTSVVHLVKDIEVSTNNTYSSIHNNDNMNQNEDIHWYAMRTTYGREKKAYEYILSKGGYAFYPIITTFKQIKGKIVRKEQSRIPNIFFIRGTEKEAQHYAYDNVHLPFLRFYYSHHREGVNIIKTPLIVPDKQIKYLQILCDSNAEDILLVPNHVKNFHNGDQVRIIDGSFKGIEGKISRWQGQQRVGIEIDGLCTFATAYIPTAFVEKL